jgi:hypothetical protein
MRSLRFSVDPRLAPHLLVLAAVAAGTLLLACCPQVILQAGYRCGLQMLLGVRCPFCGMTRDFAAILHGGRPTQNPCSWFAACAVYLLYPLAVLAAWKRNRLEIFHSKPARTGVIAVLVVMLVINNWR